MSFVWIASLLFLTTSSLSSLCFIFFQSHNKDREPILSVNEKAVFITAVFCTLMFTALLYSKIGSHEDVIVAQLLEYETPSSEDSEINEELIDEIVGQSVDIYKVDVDESDMNMYGESDTK